MSMSQVNTPSSRPKVQVSKEPNVATVVVSKKIHKSQLGMLERQHCSLN